MAVFVYNCERASGLWSIMTSREPCFLLDGPREMVSGTEEEEVFDLGSPQRSRRKLRRLLS